MLNFKILLILPLLFCAPIFGADSDLYKATVRINIQNRLKYDTPYRGTGTIIDVSDKALIVTAAHLFDHDKIENMLCSVDLFDYKDTPILDNTLRADIVHVNKMNDIAFLEFEYKNKPPHIKIASEFPRRTSDYMYPTIGCPLGRFPNLVRAQIICVNDNKSSEGLEPPLYKNYKLALYPHKGRSGGGLFDKNDRLIGILSYRFDIQKTSVFTSGATIAEELKIFRNKK